MKYPDPPMRCEGFRRDQPYPRWRAQHPGNYPDIVGYCTSGYPHLRIVEYGLHESPHLCMIQPGSPYTHTQIGW